MRVLRISMPCAAWIFFPALLFVAGYVLGACPDPSAHSTSCHLLTGNALDEFVEEPRGVDPADWNARRCGAEGVVR